MSIVIPVFTLVALDHEAIYIFPISIVLTAIAILLKKVLVIEVLHVFIVLFVVEKLACRYHPAISAVTSKIEFLPNLKPVMSLVTSQHTSKTKTMRLNLVLTHKFLKIVLIEAFVRMVSF